ncbi:hypothetical protein D9M71_517110 [compost metagenome]
MLEVEVAVAPFLEARIDVLAERRAGVAGDLVPVHAVFLVGVVGGQVEAAAEPPDRLFAFLLGDEEAHVGVGGRHVRVARVDHQRHAERLEAAAGQFRPVRAGRRRQADAVDVGEVHAAFLDQRAIGDHPGAPAATGGALPGVLDETGAAVFGFECGADAVLQVEQIGLDGLDTVGHGITLRAGKPRGPRAAAD